MEALHFLRPWWFLALVPLAGLLWLWHRRRASGGGWQAVVDPQLLPYLLVGESSRQRPWALPLLGLAGVLAITALAGPAWERLEQPVFRQQSALVVLLDLSRSMDATDIKPSRLARARLELRDLLAQRREGQTGLIVFAAQPFVVSPLTDDADTIAAQVPVLETDMMPAQGSRPDRAIGLAVDLLRQAGARGGTVVLIGDGLDGAPAGAVDEAVRELVEAGHRLQVLGIGTAEGAPIPRGAGGFLTDAEGGIVLPRLDAGALSRVARAGGGNYQPLRADDRDVQALLAGTGGGQVGGEAVDGLKTDQWREAGPWLLLPLLGIAALAFRRGYLVLALCALLPLPRPAAALEWSDLWLSADQQAARALEQGDAAAAAETFEDPQWQAAARYRAGEYAAAAEAWQAGEDARSHYNRGNALARAGDLQGALAAYGAALEQNPGLEDAAHNREQVERALQRQQPEGQPRGGEGRSADADGEPQAGATGDGSEGERSEGAPPEGDQAQARRDGQQDGSGGAEAPSQASAAADEQPQGAAREDESPSPAGEQADATANATADGREAEQADAASPALPAGEAQAAEQARATEQWLRRIPDDPGGLWRRKFAEQYRRHYGGGQEGERPW